MVGLVHSQQPGILQICTVFLQYLFQPLPVLFGDLQILLHQFPVGDNGDGKKLLPHLDARVFGAGWFFLGKGKYGEISVGLQNGVLYRLQIQHVLFPQMSRQFV